MKYKRKYELATRNFEYADNEFSSIYKIDRNKFDDIINEFQKVILIIIDEEMLFEQKAISVFGIYKTKKEFERKIKTIFNHINQDKNLKDYDLLANLIRTFFQKVELDERISMMVKLHFRRKRLMEKPEIKNAYELISFYVTFNGNDDQFYEKYGVTKLELKKMVQLIKEIYPEVYKLYQEKLVVNLVNECRDGINKINEIAIAIQNKEFIDGMPFRPSLVLAKMPFKDIYNEKEFKVYANVINPLLTPDEALLKVFNFSHLYTEVLNEKLKHPTIKGHVTVYNKVMTDLHPDTLRGRINAFASAIYIDKNSSNMLEAIKEYFQNTNLLVYDFEDNQNVDVSRERLYRKYKNSNFGLMQSKNICGFILDSCVFEFGEEDVWDILDYMKFYELSYTNDVFVLVAQEYKNGIISKKEIEQLREKYTKKLV